VEGGAVEGRPSRPRFPIPNGMLPTPSQVEHFAGLLQQPELRPLLLFSAARDRERERDGVEVAQLLCQRGARPALPASPTAEDAGTDTIKFTVTGTVAGSSPGAGAGAGAV